LAESSSDVLGDGLGGALREVEEKLPTLPEDPPQEAWHGEDEVAMRNGREHLLLQRVLALPEHPGGIGQEKRHVPPIGRVLNDIAGRPRSRVHDRAACAGYAVEKCRFPDIRAPDEDDGGELFGGHV